MRAAQVVDLRKRCDTSCRYDPAYWASACATLGAELDYSCPCPDSCQRSGTLGQVQSRWSARSVARRTTLTGSGPTRKNLAAGQAPPQPVEPQVIAVNQRRPQRFCMSPQPDRRLRRRSGKRSRVEAVRRVGGASGPGGAALKAYRKFPQRFTHRISRDSRDAHQALARRQRVRSARLATTAPYPAVVSCSYSPGLLV
jgi:hypothetical protein